MINLTEQPFYPLFLANILWKCLYILLVPTFLQLWSCVCDIRKSSSSLSQFVHIPTTFTRTLFLIRDIRLSNFPDFFALARELPRLFKDDFPQFFHAFQNNFSWAKWRGNANLSLQIVRPVNQVVFRPFANADCQLSTAHYSVKI